MDHNYNSLVFSPIYSLENVSTPHQFSDNTSLPFLGAKSIYPRTRVPFRIALNPSVVTISRKQRPADVHTLT